MMFLMNLEKGLIQNRLRSFLPILVIFGLVAVVALYPATLATVAVIAQIFMCGFSIVAAVLARRSDNRELVYTTSELADFVFSVHVPTHNEPPDLVIATLKSLRDQEPAPIYEVIVIDNNTRDPALWKPVESWCRRNEGFRFLHREGVEGAKSGALNIALEETRSDATHVVILDADYLVAPRFLAIAAKELQTRAVDFVQFPQSYRGCDEAGKGVALELADYFERHASAANRAGAMLLTGTLSVILRDALLRVGGWSNCTATEDADLGLRLCEAGFRGAYVQQIVGHGLLPLTLRSLNSQRYRWVSGNMRALLLWLSAHKSGLPCDHRNSLARKLLVATQLTAWANFALPATVAILITTVTSALGLTNGAQMTAWLAMITLLLVIFSSILPLCFARRGRRADIWAAICSRVAVSPCAAIATIAGMLPGDQTFEVTPKSLGDALVRPYSDTPLATVVSSVIGLFLAVEGLTLGLWMISVCGILLLLPQLAGIWTAKSLSNYTSVLRVEKV